jgi:hypothetical protein
MALPPGCAPIPVAGINPEINPLMARAAGELNAWIDYLLRPESHDGPRIYRPRPGTSGREFESVLRIPLSMPDVPYENPDKYETASVLEEFAGDTAQFFRSAQAVCGIRTATIEPVFTKLVDGFLTWSRDGEPRVPASDPHDPGKGQQPAPVPDMKYRDVTDTRINWVNMRKSWVAPEDSWAHEYERDFLDYQMRTENCLYAVAEHLIRYRAILDKAGEDILALMEALTRLCPRPAPNPGGSPDLMSIVVTGIVAVATTVITGGGSAPTAAVLFGSAVTEMVGEAVKTAGRGAEKELVLDDADFLRDVAKEYLRSVEQIEREVADALTELRDSLGRRLDQIRQAREYKPYSYSEITDGVPFFDNYRRA